MYLTNPYKFSLLTQIMSVSGIRIRMTVMVENCKFGYTVMESVYNNHTSSVMLIRSVWLIVSNSVSPHYNWGWAQVTVSPYQSQQLSGRLLVPKNDIDIEEYMKMCPLIQCEYDMVRIPWLIRIRRCTAQKRWQTIHLRISYYSRVSQGHILTLDWSHLHSAEIAILWIFPKASFVARYFTGALRIIPLHCPFSLFISLCSPSTLDCTTDNLLQIGCTCSDKFLIDELAL